MTVQDIAPCMATRASDWRIRERDWRHCLAARRASKLPRPRVAVRSRRCGFPCGELRMADRSGDIRAVIADDEPLARRGIRQLLSPHRDVTVVAEARNGIETVRAVRALRPHLLFLDVQ